MIPVLSLLLSFGIIAPAYADLFTISKQDSFRVGDRIWQNESKRSFEGLTHWNVGESFPSLGIAHFIWYPKGVQERFEETFPQLLIYLESEGVELPSFLKASNGSLWSSRDQFLKEFDSEISKKLRQFLYETRDYQIKFIISKLQQVFPLIIEGLNQDAKKKLKDNFFALLKDARGVYALIDYFNFKGAGLSSSESYNDQGWGLKQVLQCMDPKFVDPVESFKNSAKQLLKLRVLNSPPERKEQRWLQGWLNRVDTYTQPIN